MSDLAPHNELWQVIGAVVAVCVHPPNSLHFVFGRIQVWLTDWGKSMDRLLLQARSMWCTKSDWQRNCTVLDEQQANPQCPD